MDAAVDVLVIAATVDALVIATPVDVLVIADTVDALVITATVAALGVVLALRSTRNYKSCIKYSALISQAIPLFIYRM